MTNKYAFPNQEAVRVAYDISDDRIENGRRTFDVCYDIEKVFNRETYANSKKYNNHVTRYLNYAKNNNLSVREITEPVDQDKARKLYEDWWNVKIEADKLNPNHFAEHSDRYKECLELTINKSIKDAHLIGLFDNENNLLAFQTLVFVDDWAFDLSNANSRTDYAYIAEVSLVNFLKFLKDEMGRRFYNFGETGGDQGLLTYKEKLPNFRIYYGKLNVDFRRTTKDDVKKVIDFMNKNSTDENPFPTVYMSDSIEKGNVVVGEINNKIISMVELRDIVDEFSSKKLMTNLIVDSEYRCQGIATKILEKLPTPFEFFCYKTNETGNKFYKDLKNVELIGEEKHQAGECWVYKYN